MPLKTADSKQAERFPPKAVLKTFLAIFLPLELLLVILFLVFYVRDTRFDQALLAKSDAAHVELQKWIITNDFKKIIKNLLFIADSQGLKEYLDLGGEPRRQTLAQAFLRFCARQENFDQVRYLDDSGMEVVRVNFNHGQPAIVPEAQLQSKAKRYFFLDSIRLARGEVFVSPIDLNIEGQEIERPFKPTIRFATPVFDSQGRKRGILIFNYLGNEIFENLQQAEANANAPGRIMLLNAEGYWLYSPNPGETWGFMFADKKNLTFGAAHPEAWKIISTSERGQFQDAGGLFTFATVYPLRNGLKSSAGTYKAEGGESAKTLETWEYKWKVVSFMAPEIWRERSRYLENRLAVFFSLLTILFASISWVLARSRLSRLQGEVAIQLERDKFRNILDNLPDGVSIINQQYGLEYVNPVMEREFGPVDGKKCCEYFYDLQAPCTWCKNAEVFAGKSVRWEQHIPKLDRIFEIFETPLRNDDGSVSKLAIYHDMTDHRQTEAALRELGIFQQAILDGANYSIISTTPEGIMTTFNAAAERWLGYTTAEVVGKHTPAIFHEVEEVKARAAELSQELGVAVEPGFEVFVAKARLGGPDEREWTYIRKDGSRFPVLLSVTALRHEDGEITGFLGIGSDITERQRAQEAVNRLAAIVEFTDDAIIGKTLDGVIVSWNQGAERIYGYAAAEVLGRNISVLVPPDRQDEFTGILAGLRQDQRVHNYETVRIRKDGRLIDVSLTISPIRDAEGNIAGISTIARDITTSKQAEMQLRKLSMAVEQSPASVVITDTQGVIEYVNPKFTQLTGYQAEEAMGQNPRILKSGDKSPEEYRDLWETITSGREWRGVFHNRKKNGDLYWESASISPIKDGQGRITHFIAVKEDITAMRESQEKLATLSLVASKTDNAVIITDQLGFIEWVNDGFTRLTGYTFEETVGKKPGAVLQGPESDRATIQRISAQLQSRQALTAEIINYHKTGRPYWIAMDITPIFDDRGELTRFISIERDITQRKETEEALHQAKLAADAANRAKSEFLASMSHEIRTPMNAIIGMADLLSETPLTQEQQQYVEVFRSAGETLLSLINDILDLSKVEAGQITLESIDLDLAEIVEKVCEVMAFKAHQKGLELACRIMPAVPTHLRGDPVRLRQILTNLVGNAIKFTEAGEVVVEAKLASATQCPKDPAAPCNITFSIKDTGIGISPEKLEVIFEKFTQADTSTTRKYGGTGLGLAISKHLVELMGGELQVQSQVGQGSTFEFTILFLRQLEPQDKSSVPAADLKDLRVLVVDDNVTNRLILREIMTGWGARVAEAENGIQGLTELARAKKVGQPYQLVLLDGRMPQMDGFGMAEAIHGDASFSGITVMMLSSDARSGDLSRARDLGLASYLVKPVKRHDLREAIDRALHQAHQDDMAAPSPTPISPEEQRPLRILLADDSADNRLLIQAYLKKYPFQLDMAEDGEQALSKFQAGSYDLVLMDMQMPVMDGYNATRRIREWERQQQLSSTPVIALTAYALKEEIQKSLDAGCTIHLTKPIKKSVLLEAIAQYSRSSRGV